MSPHYYRRSSIHGFILILIGVILFMAFGCAPARSGCESFYRHKKKFTAWIKNKQSEKVFILDADGAILCAYVDDI